MSFVLLIIGFALLFKSADILIDSASKLAKMFAIPPLIIGFTVIAFGTSAPELVVGIFSGIKQTNLLTLGNIIGSSILNIALTIGITAIIFPLTIEKLVLFREIPLAFAVQLILAALLLFDGVLSRIDAIILIVLFIVFLFYVFKRSKDLGIEYVEQATDLVEEMNISEDTETVKNEKTFKNTSQLKLFGILLLSLIGVAVSGNLIVNSSTDIAKMFGLSDVLIGITIVSIGTTIPELVTSIIAAMKKQSDIAIGNIIGSNIFNVLLVLSASTLINPISATEGIGIDIGIMLFLTLILFILPLRSRRISKPGGSLLLTLYAAFLVFKILTV